MITSKRLAKAAAAAALATFSSAGAAYAHEAASAVENLWSAWTLSPEIVAGTLIAGLVYSAGLRRCWLGEQTRGWRHAAFFAGLAAVFLALQSPIDALAARLFSVHQVQHLLLRTVGPMLIALAWPSGLLIAGMPALLRKTLLRPVVASKTMRKAFSALAHPVSATAFFIGALYFWEIPRYHNLALLNEPIHYFMHASMLAAGLVFWWRVFERRSAPQGLRYGVRLMMLWLVILSNIVLGAYTTLKSTVLYGAYDVTGRLFDYPPLTDEQVGGIVIWIPSSMMGLIAILIVIHMWGRHETRVETRLAARGADGALPLTAAQVVRAQAGRNRTVALGLAIFAITVFTAAITLGVVRLVMGR